MLISVDAGNLWNAARAGLLTPRGLARRSQANIPAHLRDPENRWVGLTVRARTIMYNTTKVKAAELSTYEALGDPEVEGPALPAHLDAHLQPVVPRHDDQAAAARPRRRRIVRGWVANQPTLINSDTKILEAIAAGQCDVGLTNTYYLGRIVAKTPDFPVAAVLGQPADDRHPREHLRAPASPRTPRTGPTRSS